jgi:hypothetical protein
MVHEDGKQKNDWQRDSDQPEQGAFSERHDNLHSMCGDATHPSCQSSILPKVYLSGESRVTKTEGLETREAPTP